MDHGGVGLLHPGQMGSAVGAALRGRETRVCWASEGRSEASRARAAQAGLLDLRTLQALVRESGVILSICPPDAALQVARQVAAAGFTGMYVDANAVSPSTARRIGSILEEAGGSFVDGGIVGPPPRAAGTTRLYLSGQNAAAVADLFLASPLQAIPLDRPAGAASALKVAYSAYTKGTTALLLAIHALARREGVDEALTQEWKRSLPELSDRAAAQAQKSVPKAWRFVGEMEESAAAFTEAGLPGGFSSAAAAVYRQLEVYKDARGPLEMAEILSALTRG